MRNISNTWAGAFDGACQPSNPGEMAVGAWLASPDGGQAWQISEYLGRGTSNEAEWTALVRLLEAAAERRAFPLTIIGDSQLVVRQFNREYAVRSGRLSQLAERAWAIARSRKVDVRWVPREQNERADALSAAALNVVVPLRFPPSGLRPIGPALYAAEGTGEYVVDTRRQTCSCPAFQYQKGACKHLIAAFFIEGREMLPAR